jgi:hypothetical protein
MLIIPTTSSLVWDEQFLIPNVLWDKVFARHAEGCDLYIYFSKNALEETEIVVHTNLQSDMSLIHDNN